MSLKESHLQPSHLAFVIQAPGTGALGSQELSEPCLASSQPLLWTSKDKKHKKRWEFQEASSNKKIVNGTTNKKANLVQKICLFYFPLINIAPKVNLSPCSHKAHPGLLKYFTLGLPNKSNKNNDTIIPLLSLFSVLHLQI